MGVNNVFFEERDSLAHHGVIGMKWGIRRYQPYSTVPRRSGKSGREIGDAKKTKSEKKKKRSAEQDNRQAIKNKEKEMKLKAKYRKILSEEELRSSIDRIKREQELKRLTEETLHPGRMAVKKILADSATDIARSTLIGVGKYAIRKSLGETDKEGNKINKSEIAEYLKPKKK